MVTETDRNKARSAVVSAYNELDCVTIPFSFLHAFADAAVDAVSTDAEPVAWQPRYKQEVIDHLRTVSDDVSEYAMTVFPTKEQAEEYGHGGHVVRPLYAEPVSPAPAVAVKAIEPVWIKHDGKSMPVNAETVVEVRMAGGFEHEEDLAGNWLEREGSKSNWHHDLGCAHPCDIVAYRIVKGSPALSAQVQDVAGWRDFSNAPKDGSKFDVWYAPRLGLEGYRRVDVYWSDIQDTFCTDGSFGPDEPCPILMHPGPTHYMPLPASPASKHGDAE